MKRSEQDLTRRFANGLAKYEASKGELKGLKNPAYRGVFIRQLVASFRRTQFPKILKNRKLGVRFTDPNDDLFDPIKAAVVLQRNGKVEEAFWMVFLFVHFGKSRKGGYRYAREVYGRLGDGQRWDWVTTSKNPQLFRMWLKENRSELERKEPPGGFGNHRKYESLDATGKNGTGATVASYVSWVGAAGSHTQLISDAVEEAAGDPYKAFDNLYRTMKVARFGRTARFDYLTMLGKLGLAPIEPGSAYIGNSTGPLSGGRLLLDGSKNGSATPSEIDDVLLALDEFLQAGMQALEDALCNWQKKPDFFQAFRG